MKDFIHAHRELEAVSRRLHRGISMLSVVVIIMVVIGGVLIGSIGWYSENLKPREERASTAVLEIDEGASVVEIANLLEDRGFIRSSTAFIWYVQSQGQRGSLKAGTYEISADQSVETIVETLSQGSTVQRTVTITPGLRLDEVVDVLSEYEFFERSELEQALFADNNHPLLATNPDKDKLEGYIFPETYSVDFTVTADDFLTQVFDIFYSQLTSEITIGLDQQGLSIHEAVILASIVQQEEADPETQRKVAQVFLSRLEQGEPLGSDPTFVYAARILGVEATPDLDNPYNTRINGGLPPGPIGNFNFSALEAVANPSDTDYLFFVAGDDGNTYFSETLAEHEANVEKYCDRLCSLEILNP